MPSPAKYGSRPTSEFLVDSARVSRIGHQLATRFWHGAVNRRWLATGQPCQEASPISADSVFSCGAAASVKTLPIAWCSDARASLIDSSFGVVVGSVQMVGAGSALFRQCVASMR